MTPESLLGRDAHCRLDVLCQHCERVITKSELLQTTRKQTNKSEHYNHHEDYHSFHASANEGCHLCSLGVAALSAGSASLLQSRGSYKVTFRVWRDEKTQLEREANPGWWNGRYCWCWASLAVVLSGSEPNQPRLEGSLYVARVVEGPVGRALALGYQYDRNVLSIRDPDPAQLSCYTGSEVCISLAKRWLDACLHDSLHQSTCRTYGGYPMPTRLLNVLDLDSPSQLRVILGSTIPRGTPYITLSYCWGGGAPFVLTMENLEMTMRGIEIEMLSKTIADAVMITRRLGYRYLWVDSLCIIQNSTEDWKAEAARMGEVYSNSTVTISATSASDSTQGCLFERAPLSYLPLKVRGSWSNGIYVARDRNSRQTRTIFKDYISKAPLNTRGWVVQERMLSQRILHFTSQGIFWECNKCRKSESAPEGTPKLTDGTENISWLLRPRQRSRRYRNETILERMYNDMANRWALSDRTNHMSEGRYTRGFTETWCRIVLEYTKCNLTKNSDRESAIMGIASEISRATGLKYRLGLWHHGKSHVCPTHQLMWVVKQPCARPTRARAPSWTWLAVDGPIGHLASGRAFFHDAAINGEGPRGWRATSYITNDALGELESDESASARSESIQLRAKAIRVPYAQLGALQFRADVLEDTPLPAEVLVVRVLERRQPGTSFALDRYRDFDEGYDIAGLVLREADSSDGAPLWTRMGAFELWPRYDERSLLSNDLGWHPVRNPETLKAFYSLQLSESFNAVEEQTIIVK